MQRRPGDPADPPPALRLLGRTKTTAPDEAERVLLIGRPVEALRLWLLLAPSQSAADTQQPTKPVLRLRLQRGWDPGRGLLSSEFGILLSRGGCARHVAQ